VKCRASKAAARAVGRGRRSVAVHGWRAEPYAEGARRAVLVVVLGERYLRQVFASYFVSSPSFVATRRFWWLTIAGVARM
jgi:hypothetical protein